MCMGTMCTHHLNPVVQGLEQDYGKFDHPGIVPRGVHEGDDNGICFKIPIGIMTQVRVGHLQPMFTLKLNDPGDWDRDTMARWPEPFIDQGVGTDAGTFFQVSESVLTPAQARANALAMINAHAPYWTES